MANQSISIGSLCQLLNSLNRNLAGRTPISLVLDDVAAHFAANLVALKVTHCGRDAQVHFGYTRRAGCDNDMPADPHAAMVERRERDHQLSVESQDDATGDYALCIFRSRDDARFDTEDRGVAELVLSQIAGALRLAARIDSSAVECSLYSDALDKLNVGVILVDATGQVANASSVAERFLRAKNGVQLFGNKVRASNAAEDRELQAAIRAAGLPQGAACASRGLSLTRNCGARTLGVMVRPAPAMPGDGPRLVALYVRDCELAPEVESEFVRQIFDLTPAEAAVTRRLTAGLSLEDAATSLDISRNTARAHLRSIFSKSGITRQTELVRLVLNSAALLGERQAA